MFILLICLLGCPYKHFDKANLKKLLTTQGVKDKPLKAILELAEQKQFNNACLRYFEAKHDVRTQKLFTYVHSLLLLFTFS